ncbi:2248_t:CDS:2, partial [Gigaspora margarita]
ELGLAVDDSSLAGQEKQTDKLSRTNVLEEGTLTKKPPSKKQKTSEEISANLKKLIKELTAKESQVSEIGEEEGENSENLLHLYNRITNAEIHNEITSQEVIKSYYLFGKVLSERFKYYYNKSFNEHSAQIDVNEELRKQLPDTTETTRNKRKERAQKIYFLFNSIGIEKIGLVKSFSANSISKLSVENIKYIKDKI